MIHGKHLELSDLRVNMKVRIRSPDDEAGYVMVIHQINGTEIAAARPFKGRGPEGVPGFRFTFYVNGVTFKDGTGKPLIVERFQREDR